MLRDVVRCGCANDTRTGAMSAPVLSRASLSATARANSVRAECNGVVAVSWTRNSRLSPSRCVRAATRSLIRRPYRARRSNPFSSEGLARRAYSMRSSAPRGSDSARWMPSASSPVRLAARRHAFSVSRLRRCGRRDRRAWSPKELADRRGADVAALNPGDEVRQHPALYG